MMKARTFWIFGAMVALLVFSPLGIAGSIYKESKATTASLWEDFKAHRVGDVVTILIVETNSASESSEVATGKKHDSSFKLMHLFGLNKLFNGEPGNLTEAGFSGNNKFDGAAKTSNTGRVSAQVTATVKEVMPNGNLLLEGRRTLHINKEQKNIILTGMIRPQDITKENTVRSTSIADAQITFEGFGDVSNQSQPGLLSKLLNLIPLF